MGALSNAAAIGAISYNVKDVETNIDINLGNGNHDLEIDGSGNDISVGDGNSNIKVVGSNTNVKTGDGNNKIVHYGSDSTISTGDGNQNITSIGDNKTITTGDGDDEVIFLGDNITLNGGNGDNNVVFWGNNVNITLGEGNDDVTTFDQIYNKGGYSDLNEVFLNTLGTGIWEDWNKISRHQIDYICQKSFMSKSQTWVFEDTYQVDTYFSRYVNGLKNVNIDLGGGSNTANLTIDKATSKVIDNGKVVVGKNALVNKSDNIKLNEDYSYDTLLDSRKETRLDSHTKSNTRWGGVFIGAVVAIAAIIVTWGAAAPAVAAAFGSAAAACGATAAGVATATAIGTTVGTAVGVVGAASAALTACDIAYKVGTGQTLHTGDWVNMASSAASFAGGGWAVAGNLLRAGYQVSQEDYIGAAVSIGSAGLGAVGTDCLNIGADATGNLTGWGQAAHAFNLGANLTNVVDKGIAIAEGDAKFGDYVSLLSSGISASYSGCTLGTNSDLLMSDYCTETKEDDVIIENEKGEGIDSEGTIHKPDGTKIKTDGTVIKPDGTVVKPSETAAAGQDKTVANGTKTDATKPVTGKTESIKSTVDTKTQVGTDGAADASKSDQTWLEKGFDKTGDVIGKVVELPGKIIGDTTSFIGKEIIGDNMIGNGIGTVGDWLSGAADGLGSGVNSFIDGTGSFVVSPIETTKGWFKDSETTTTTDNKNTNAEAADKLQSADTKDIQKTGVNSDAKLDTKTDVKADVKTESTGLKWLGEKVIEGTKYVGGKIADGATYIYDKTVDGAVYIGDKAYQVYDKFDGKVLPTDVTASLDFSVNKMLGKYDEDEEIEVYIV